MTTNAIERLRESLAEVKKYLRFAYLVTLKIPATQSLFVDQTICGRIFAADRPITCPPWPISIMLSRRFRTSPSPRFRTDRPNHRTTINATKTNIVIGR